MFKYNTKRILCPVKDRLFTDKDVKGVLCRSIDLGDDCVINGVPRVYITSINDNDSEVCAISDKDIFQAISIGKNCFLDSTEAAAFPNPPIKLTCNKFSNSELGVIKIGSNCTLQGTSICSYRSVSIGNNVMFGPNVVIMDSDGHALTGRGGSDEASRVRIKPVRVEDDAWVGYGSIILPGVTIGRGSVIGAGSVVTKDIPAGIVAGGNPCRKIRNL